MSTAPLTAPRPAAAPRAPFADRLRQALAGDPAAPLVLLGNFEVENAWAEGEIGLPRIGGASATASLVNRMDEFALLLGRPGDRVVLKQRPDADYLDYLRGLGLELPEVLVPEHCDPDRTVTEDALASPRLLDELRALAADGAKVFAHGMSDREERLAVATGLGSAHPPVADVKGVNGKVYSRELCDELGIEQAEGWTCRTVDDFTAAAGTVRDWLAAGIRVGVKDSYGVSGKGIVVLDDARRFDQLVRMVERRAAKTGDDRLAVVVETWADKDRDFNYHFTVGHDGGVEFDFVQEAITEQGVHKGHRIDRAATAELADRLAPVAARLGERLRADGFWGPVGVDAITTRDGGLLPVLDINARNNMSTYQTGLQERLLGDGLVAMARHYPVTLTERLPFAALREALGDALLAEAGGTGLVVNNFATANAAAGTGAHDFQGRIHAFVVADDADGIAETDRTVTARLAEAESKRSRR